MTVPHMTLNDGSVIPQLGLGVWQVEADIAKETVLAAFDAGYRHIDTAALYHNEGEVGAAIAASGLAREEIFVTTKLANDRHRRADAIAACEESLRKLGLDYVDLYLIHWPCPSEGRQVEAWQGLIDLRDAGKARSIGVSNYRAEDLHAIVEQTGVMPSVNQIELHPSFQQPVLRELHSELRIATEAWSPLGVGADLKLPEVRQIAQAHGVTPAQAVIRWHLQLGNIVFPKTTRPERMKENLDVGGFELSDDEMALMAKTDTGERQGWDPATM